MAVESATDRASLFATADWAVAGTYTPAGGAGIAVDAILDEPHTDAGVGLVGVVDRGYVARVRVDQLGAAARGDSLAIGAVTWRVRKAMREGPDGQVWLLELEI